MSATYTSPDNSDSDWVRFKVGDTDVTGTEAVLSDEEINAELTEKGNKWPAAHACALQIARRYQLFALKAANPDLMKIADGYKKLAEGILRESSAAGFTPFFPARSIDEKDATLDDTDRVDPRFARGMHRLESDHVEHTRDDNL